MQTNPKMLETQMALEQEWLRAKARNSVFSGQLMNNPAWDLVLRVAIGERVSLSDLTNDSTISSDALSRWVDLLIDHDIMDAEAEKDTLPQRKFISLSHSGKEKIGTYLSISERKFATSHAQCINQSYNIVHEIRETCIAISCTLLTILIVIFPMITYFSNDAKINF